LSKALIRSGISTAAFNRAVKMERRAEVVNYVDVLVRDNGICCLCQKSITKGPGKVEDYLQFDHVIALEDGGPHTMENVRAVHAVCHSEKHTAGKQPCTRQASARVHSNNSAEHTAGLAPSITESTSQPTSDISFAPGNQSSVEIGPPLALTSPEPEDLPKRLDPDDPDIEKLYAIKKAVEFMWDFDAVPFDWSEADTKAAKVIITELRGWQADDFSVAVVYRFQSFQINSAETPRHWLKKLQKYGFGPLDEYGHDKLLTPQDRQNERAKVLAALAGRKPAGEQIVLQIDSSA
jgi:hypothetical protein